jgi:WXXGXW repeat (2 copies)
MKNIKMWNCDLTGVAKTLRRVLHAIVFCSLIFVLQSCGPHYVAEVPVGSVDVRPASPYAGAVWIDGEWAWGGGRHNYVGGHWDHPRSGRTWQGGEWRQSPRGHYWVHGTWR